MKSRIRRLITDIDSIIPCRLTIGDTVFHGELQVFVVKLFRKYSFRTRPRENSFFRDEADLILITAQMKITAVLPAAPQRERADNFTGADIIIV